MVAHIKKIGSTQKTKKCSVSEDQPVSYKNLRSQRGELNVKWKLDDNEYKP